MSVDIVSLQCPVCGAPFSPEDEKCGYCGSILVLRTDHPKINPSTLNRLVVDKHISEYRQDLKRDPSDTTAHYGLGVAYFNLGLTDDAVRELEEAARLMPENANIQSQLAVVLRKAMDEGRPGSQQKLRDRIEYTLRLDPDDLDALILKATTDSRLSRSQALETLERAYNAHARNPPARLVAALSRLGMSHGFLSEREIDLLRRSYSIDKEGMRKPLFDAVLKRAKALSATDPVVDTEDPARASKAMDLWKELSSIDGVRSREELVQYLLFSAEIPKSDQRKIKAMARNSADNVISSSASEPTSTKSPTPFGFSQYLKAILIGLLQALGILLGIFILFGVVLASTSSGSALSTIVAAVFGLGLIVLPLLLPTKQVRKKKSEAVHGLRPAFAQGNPKETAHAGQSKSEQYAELLNILRKHFIERWERQSVLRVTADASKSGMRGERQRNKVFLA